MESSLIVGSLMVRKKVGLSQSNHLRYTLNISDAKDNNAAQELEVSFSEKEIKTINFQYDTDKLTKPFIYNGPTELEQNAEVKTGTKKLCLLTKYLLFSRR